MRPPSILLMGASGTGKTYSISTLLKAGLECFLVVTEPHGLETLLDVTGPEELQRLHWAHIEPARPEFKTQVNLAKLISSSNQQALSALPPMPRADASWIRLLETFVDFKDERTKKAYGPITSFDDKRCVVIDSLSGLNAMAMDVTIGDKVTANPGEWGIAMRALDKFLLSCTSSLGCYFVLIAHVEKEIDEMTGVSKTMVSTLGKKLAPQVPKFFSEVVMTTTESQGDKRSFYWSTNEPNTILKNRSLPIGSKLQPSFEPVVAAYRRRLDKLSG